MARPRGAIPSPRHKAFATPTHVASAVPETFGVIPSTLSYWGNDVDGDCVSAEEAFAKAAYSLMFGGTSEVFITYAEVVSWASANGYLNGADLTSVMESMAQSGMSSNGQTYDDGPYQSVDWTTDATLSSAIYNGPVKIGVAADQLENIVGTSNGWVATGFTEDANEDHCVSLCGFGSMQDLCTLLSVAVPSGVDPTTRAYLLFTWCTVGIIDQASMIAITGEAWLRMPTTVGVAPGPTPTPTPTPTPVPVPTPTPTPTPVPVPVPTPTPPVPTADAFVYFAARQFHIDDPSWVHIVSAPVGTDQINFHVGSKQIITSVGSGWTQV